MNVRSDSHQTQILDLNNLQLKTGYRNFMAYGRSKLANLYITYELARRLSGKKITVYAYNPSLSEPNIGNDNFLGKIIMPLVNRFAIPVEQGAKTGIFLASQAYSWPIQRMLKECLANTFMRKNPSHHQKSVMIRKSPDNCGKSPQIYPV